MSPEIAAKNKAWMEKHKAKREARTVAKAGKKPKKFVQPKPADVKAAVAKHVEDVKREAAKQSKVTGSVRAAVKERYPNIKGLADATRAEMDRVLNAHEGDSIIAELQETWAKRTRARHEAWLKGDSASAKAARERKRGTIKADNPR